MVAMNIYDELNKLAERAEGYDGWYEGDEEDGDWRNLSDEIADLLGACGVTQYEVENVVAFESCGLDAGVVCASWVDDGQLYTYNVSWSRC